MNLRIGVVPYLNALPLCRYLANPVQFGTPRELHRQMKEGKLDVALLPVFSFFQNPNFLPFYEAGAIQSDGPVMSVALFYREKLEKPDSGKPTFIRSINYSEESMTSIALFKVIYSQFWRMNLKTLIETKTDADARLLIGDAALFFNEPGYKRIDLGEEWKKRMGLPFVYAIWVSREPLDKETIKMFIDAKKEGLRRIDEIVDEIDEIKDFPKKQVLSYLTKSIQYEINIKSLEGLKKFQDYCYQIGLLEKKRRLLGL